MKKSLILGAMLGAIFLSGCATNQPYNQYGYQQGCRGQTNYTGAVLGGVGGALLGSRFGKGNGNTAAIAAGSALGATYGSQTGVGCN